MSHSTGLTNMASKPKKTGKCHVCGDTGHYAWDCIDRISDSMKELLNETTGNCHVCGDSGHYAQVCKDRKSETPKLVLKETIGSVTRLDSPLLSNTKDQGWYLFSRSSVHVCHSRDMFVDYWPMRVSQVILDNNEHLDMVGCGTVKLRLTTGKVLTLSEVFHIPAINQCRISVSKLDDTGFSILFGGAECVIMKRQKVVGKAYRENGAYRLSIMEEPPIVKVVHNETIGLFVFGEDPELTKARARGWYLLPTCSVHVCNSRDMFVDYQPVIGHEVVLDNNDHVDVLGFGTVMLPLTTGKVLTLTNVFHMPAIIKCCISVAKLCDMDFTVLFRSKECFIKKGEEIVGIGYNDGLHRLSVREENSDMKVVHDETISIMVVNEDPELAKERARGWYLASRCTVHVCNSRDMFADYHPLRGHEVIMDYGSHVKVTGVGTVKLRLTTGKILTLRNVFHMPKISRCLISVARLELCLSLRGIDCEIKKDDEVMGKGYLDGGLIRLRVVDECQGERWD